MSSLSLLLNKIMAQVAEIDGIRSVYECPPEEVGPTPVAVAYPESGMTTTEFHNEKLDLVSVVVEVMVPRNDLAKDVAKVVAFHDSVLNALVKDPKFDGAADTFDYIEWTFGPLAWGEIEMVGYKFIIRGIKIRTLFSGE